MPQPWAGYDARLKRKRASCCCPRPTSSPRSAGRPTGGVHRCTPLDPSQKPAARTKNTGIGTDFRHFGTGFLVPPDRFPVQTDRVSVQKAAFPVPGPAMACTAAECRSFLSLKRQIRARLDHGGT